MLRQIKAMYINLILVEKKDNKKPAYFPYSNLFNSPKVLLAPDTEVGFHMPQVLEN